MILENPEKWGFLGRRPPHLEKTPIYGVFCGLTRFILREMP
jgi:hypothetical protein